MKNKLVYLSQEKIEQICCLAAYQNRMPLQQYLMTSLDENELTELTALMWFGRSESRKLADYTEYLLHANIKERSAVSGYIAGKSPLESYLRDGLKQLIQ